MKYADVGGKGVIAHVIIVTSKPDKIQMNLMMSILCLL